MKKVLAILVLALMVFSAVPVLADYGDKDVLTKTDSVDVKDAADTDGVDSDVEVKTEDEKTGEKTRTSIKSRMMDISAKDFGAIRDHQLAQLRIALEKCGENSECKISLEKRIALVKRLSDMDAERLKRHIEAREKIDEKIEELKKHKDLSKFKEERKFKARTLAESKKADAKARFEEAKRHFEEVKASIKDAKEDLMDASDEEKAKKANNYLGHVLDAIEKHLNKVLAKVEENEYLTEAQVSELTSAINERLEKVSGLRSGLESATTRDEIKALAKDVRELLKDVKDHTKVASGKAFSHRMGGVIVQSEHLQAKLEKVLERMTENGLDTSSAESLISEFGSLIDSAKVRFEAAIAKFKEAESLTGDDRAEVIKQAQSSMREAQADLKEARAKLKEITRSVKAQGDEAEDALDEETEDDDDEEEEEVEDSEDESEEEESEEEE
ncbi:MAG TPA: hypothetical protein VJJ53_03410 [Candidatus Nanoarchaeia archaeon]|nr:hypothetical protein [Candidatus Nanoarchaeia archaeon]